MKGGSRNSLIDSLDRRTLLKLAGGMIAANQGLTPSWAAGEENIQGDLELARKEGEFVFAHEDQENEGLEMAQIFTQRTGIRSAALRLNAGPAYQKLLAETATGKNDIDVWHCADFVLADACAKRGEFLRYVSPEMSAYDAEDVSKPLGFWTSYYLNTMPIMYNPKFVDPASAPKTWLDLLDPKWKGKVGFQTSGSGTSFALWFLLKDILPPDYFDRLAEQKPRGYVASTQQVSDLQNGNLLVASVSVGRYYQLRQKNIPMNVVFPPEGTPSNTEVSMIWKQTKRPNASKIFVNYLLSKQGQTDLGKIKGWVPSPRRDVTFENAPINLNDYKILKVKDLATFSDPEIRKTYVKVWRNLTGM